MLWSTASEQNNKGFELQHSINGTDFSPLNFVRSQAPEGNSNSSLNYIYPDEKPFAGTTYYRLKQINNDNKASFSGVVAVRGTRANTLEMTTIYPNPAKSKLNVVIAAPTSERINLVITDLAGKIVMQQSKVLNTGDNNTSLNVEKLPAGTYMLKAVCNSGCETAVSKFVKQ